MARRKKRSDAADVPRNPLAEVFGFPINNHSDEAVRHRAKKLCPFNNKVPNCTKDKANDPLGTCSINTAKGIVITCPVRLRQDWIIADHAAEFFFPAGANWTSLTEVRLNDKSGKSAGNIDVVLVSYDDRGKIMDFGALEVQSVYISGNVRKPFEKYMENPQANANMDWSGMKNYPSPDYLSSSRKRLAPQLIYKGGILNAWKKKIAVAINTGFYNELPELHPVIEKQAEVAWLVYDLRLSADNCYNLERIKTEYTDFRIALDQITKSEAGDIENFIDLLQTKLDEKLEDSDAPETPTIDELL